jgi:hypothetical protein
MAFKDIAKSGALGIPAALIADNPKLLQGMGVAGNLAYKSINDREDEKVRQAAGMKKGGSVKSSASRRADGIASRGKTKGRML